MTALAINWGNVAIIVCVGIVLVVVVLILLIGILEVFGRIMAPRVKVKKTTQSQEENQTNVVIKEREGHIPALDGAAIATALHLYFDDVHDEESRVITIKTVERRYSPWNSKIYGLNNNLTR